VDRGVCCFTSGVRHRFPKDIALQELVAESYVGTTLWGFNGKPIGLIAVIGRRPLTDQSLAESVVKLVSLRAAGELERLDAEDALWRINRDLENRVRLRTEQLQRLSARLITAQESERKRVAQELHDSLGQSLSAIKMMGERALCGVCAQGLAGHMSGMESLMRVVQSTVDDVRRISMALRPSTLDDLGLLSTFSWLTREFQVAYPNIQVEKVVEIEESWIPEPLKITLFRVVQEALNNAAKHSQADKIIFTLKRIEGALRLTIEDNGVGFDTTARRIPNPGGGHGLPSMRERTELSGGHFTLASAPGSGTQIEASWLVPTP
jgi:signal transduction histidine kinase